MAKTPELDLRKPRKNYFINSDMAIAQRGTSFASLGNGQYTVDRFQYIKVGAMVHTVSQDTDVPTLAQSGYLFQNSLRLNLTTPDTSIASTDYCGIGQILEGYNWRNLAQKAFTIGFWVKATLPGTYSIGMQNSAADRGYAAEYTINSANTWEYKTITIPASVSAGTWNYTNGVGLKVWWMVAVGSSFQFATGSWQSGTVLGTANQVNGTNTGATDFRITGVTINEGSEAMPFALYSNDAAAEIQACQRYYEKSYDITTNPATVTTVGAFRGQTGPNGIWRGYMSYLVSKRSTPNSITFYNSSTGATGQAQLTGTGGVSVSATVNSHSNFSWETAGGLASNTDIFLHFATDAELS